MLLRTAVGVILLFIMLPLLSVLWVSVFNDPVIAFPPSGYSFRWFAAAWEQAAFRSGFITSIWLAAIAAIGSLLLGVPASLVLARGDFRGREAIRTVLLAPLMVPGIVAGSAVFIFFIRFEIVSGIQIAGTFLGLVMAHIVIAIPWTVRFVTASLVGVDRSIEDAAISLGASSLTVVRRITLPIIRPAMVASAMLSFIVSFIDLEKSLFLVGPGQTTLPIAIIGYLEWSLDPSIAAVSTMQIAVIMVGLAVVNRYVRLAKVF
ncbi:MAG: ABC transporter permease [Variibacter sp.]